MQIARSYRCTYLRLVVIAAILCTLSAVGPALMLRTTWGQSPSPTWGQSPSSANSVRSTRGVKMSTRPRIQPPSERAVAEVAARSSAVRRYATGRQVAFSTPGQRLAQVTPGNGGVSAEPGESAASDQPNDNPLLEGSPEMNAADFQRVEETTGDRTPYYGDSLETPDCAECNGEVADGGTCDDGVCGGSGFLNCTRWSAGVEFTVLTPHFEQNPAILRRESNNAGLDTLSEQSFDYGTSLAPRVWLETMQGEALGFRLTYWQFDQAADNATQSPPANGFGRIQSPPFGNIDLSATTPGSTLTAGADINAYTLDIEATQCFNTGIWGWLGTAGVRYGEADQSYTTRLTNAAGNAQGRIDYNHRVQGVGPTLSIRTNRPFIRNLSLFGQARGSLLFGDGESTLQAIEDQDLANPLTTNQSNSRDDLLPIGEFQLGVQFTPPCGRVRQPYLHAALEGQVWNGAGSATSEVGNLGFFGFNVAVGFDW